MWARLTLALEANERGLARYLLRFFDDANAGPARLYYDVHVRPRTVRSLSRFPDTDGGRRALRHGLLRYADDEPESAAALWREAEAEYAFSSADKRYIHDWLTAASADAGRVPSEGPDGFSAAAVEAIADALLRHEHWGAAAGWIAALPESLRATPEWRYWLGRALDGAAGAPPPPRSAASRTRSSGSTAPSTTPSRPSTRSTSCGAIPTRRTAR